MALLHLIPKLAAVTSFAALSVASVAPGASAQMYDTGTFGAWTTSAGDNDNGYPMCAIGVFAEDKAFWIKVSDKHPSMVFFQLFKLGWTTAGHSVDLQLQVDNALALRLPGHGIAGPAAGRGGVEAGLSITAITTVTGRPAVAETLDLLTTGRQLTIRFPAGNERPWLVSLNGSARAVEQFIRCMESDAGHAAPQQPYSTQPFGNPSVPATQPFGKPEYRS